jgi:anti-sigma regulatory factor (Ser/Thr protein kinase)
MASFPVSFDFSCPGKRNDVREHIKRRLRAQNSTAILGLNVAVNEALMNAVQYGGPLIRVRINKISSYIIIRVKDDGPGFAGNALLSEYEKIGLDQLFDQLTGRKEGRGIPIMMAWTDKLLYSARGNEVMLIKKL